MSYMSFCDFYGKSRLSPFGPWYCTYVELVDRSKLGKKTSKNITSRSIIHVLEVLYMKTLKNKSLRLILYHFITYNFV